MQSYLGSLGALLRRIGTARVSDITRSLSTGPIEEAVKEGSKAKILKVLSGLSQPHRSAELWELSKEQGVPSKRRMKMLLNEMRKSGVVKTCVIPGTAKTRKGFGYYLPKPVKEQERRRQQAQQQQQQQQQA